MLTLRGITWDHPRGLEPLADCSAEWSAGRGVTVEWAARSLEAFEATPLDVLAGQCDLMVIDHPHVGDAVKCGSVRAFDEAVVRAIGLAVGRSHESYFFAGRQWALAIDAAAQVACRREGAMSSWPATWAEAVALARGGRVLWPLAPVHALMSFFTLCANIGAPCRTEGPTLIADRAAAASMLGAMCDLAGRVPNSCFEMNPIRVLECLASGDADYAPHTYGYVSYARTGFRRHRLAFSNLPGLGASACRGSTLGGTGIAVSAHSSQPAIAAALAAHLASAGAQRGTYARRGQPAHRAAWTDPDVDRAAGGFYSGTLATLDAAWVRPRFAGYVPFQSVAGRLVVDCVRGERSIEATLDRLDEGFASAQEGTGSS